MQCVQTSGWDRGPRLRGGVAEVAFPSARCPPGSALLVMWVPRSLLFTTPGASPRARAPSSGTLGGRV